MSANRKVVVTYPLKRLAVQTLQFLTTLLLKVKTLPS
jgi:hypothetical protein